MRCHQTVQTHRTKGEGAAGWCINSFWKMVTYILLKLCFVAEPKRDEMKVCVGVTQKKIAD